MSCNSCAKSFSILRQEKGCPNCGFSYCSKCLDNKLFVKKLNAEAKVCLKCKKSATAAPTNDSMKFDAPDSYYKRIGAMEDKSSVTNSASKSQDELIRERLQKLKERSNDGQGVTNEEISERLQNIKGPVPSTSDSELQERLAKLRGVPISVIQSKPVLPAADLRTEQEQADDLMRQYMEQVKIDTKYKDNFDEIINTIESRVEKLKGTSGAKEAHAADKDNPESEDEEEKVRKIVEKVKAEAAIEDDISPSTNDELPFCEICNEDAKMRCLGCRYLFCKRCFMEHKDDDDDCNRYELYEPPKGEQH